MFENLPRTKQDAFGDAENSRSPEILVNPEQQALERVRADYMRERDMFYDRCESARVHLPPGAADRFAGVANLPELFEKKIRGYAAMPEQANIDLTSPETIKYLKSYLLNYNTRESGDIVHAMESVLGENTVRTADGSDDLNTDVHVFFREAPVRLIETIAHLVAQERHLGSV